MNNKIDLYINNGCGRCDYYKTSQCKVHTWTEELKALRKIALECGLIEELKWSQPCYTFNDNNIFLITAFKDYAAMAFFKGALLNDPQKKLIAPGKSSQAVKQLRFTACEEINNSETMIKSFIQEALSIEEKGLKIEFKKNLESIPEELIQKFKEIPELKSAFEALTPGRQRGYILHFSQPKLSATRVMRIEKNLDKILSGKGFHE